MKCVVTKADDNLLLMSDLQKIKRQNYYYAFPGFFLSEHYQLNTNLIENES